MTSTVGVTCIRRLGGDFVLHWKGREEEDTPSNEDPVLLEVEINSDMRSKCKCLVSLIGLGLSCSAE